MYEILFVEDDDTIGFIIKRFSLWENSSFHIRKMVTNGKLALKELRENPVYHLVITDIRMPVMDGLEMVSRMKEEGIHVPVLLASTYSEFEYVKKGLRLGALDYIVKPYTNENMKEALALAELVLKKEQERSIYARYVPESIKEICREEFKNEKEQSMSVRIIMFLSEHACSDSCMEDMETEIGLSRDYLGKLLKSKTGTTLNEMITMIKMEYAKKYLEDTTMKVYEISVTLGYSTVDYFTKLFRKYVGKTPIQYRREKQNSEIFL